ncbi:MAG TPA: glutamyl-tRNA reductase [Actinomycetota bacterium]
MPLLVAGVSHRDAPLGFLERLSIPGEELPKAYRHLADAPAVRESVVLCTCNRVELVAEVEDRRAGLRDLVDVLAASSAESSNVVAGYLHDAYEDEAVVHLFRVAAGLDSMVVGEAQVLSQVRRAHRVASDEGAAGAELSSVFAAAVRAGRRVRTQTSIGASALGFAEAGIRLAEDAIGPLGGRSAVVIGAGQIASVVIEQLRIRGVGRIRIVNRTPERARVLAAREGAEAFALPDLPVALAGCELVVTCTGSNRVVLGRDDMARAAAPDRRVFVLDLGVPRNVDPSVRTLPGARLADIEDLRELVGDGAARSEVRRAEELVREEASRFSARRRAARLAPLIRGLKDAGDAAVAAELARWNPRLRELDPSELEAVAALARGVAAKLLHGPIVTLKALSGDGADEFHARALADLFGIEYPGEDQPRTRAPEGS